jgi:hypothetical protein
VSESVMLIDADRTGSLGVFKESVEDLLEFVEANGPWVMAKA